jgi:uncharacterized MAPEG superfamily protein
MTPTLTALVGFALWTIALTALIPLVRMVIMQTTGRKPGEFDASGKNIGGFSFRLARAHANCCEFLPIFGVVMLTAHVSGNGALSDPWALWILYFRLGQSLVHLSSISNAMLFVRFLLFIPQVVLTAMVGINLIRSI